MGWEKAACWSTKSAIFWKRVKTVEKLLNNALLNTAIPDPMRPPLPQFGGLQPQRKTPIAIISGTGEAMDFKFGWKLEHSQCPSKQKPIKNFGENRAWAYPGTAQIFCVPLIISGTGKATNFKFCTHIHSINRKKRPLKISRKVAVGIVRDS